MNGEPELADQLKVARAQRLGAGELGHYLRRIVDRVANDVAVDAVETNEDVARALGLLPCHVGSHAIKDAVPKDRLACGRVNGGGAHSTTRTSKVSPADTMFVPIISIRASRTRRSSRSSVPTTVRESSLPPVPFQVMLTFEVAIRISRFYAEEFGATAKVDHTKTWKSTPVDSQINLAHDAAMKKDDVVKHFGSDVAVADALGISRQAVSKWGEIIPEGVAYKLQVLTAGHLVVDPSAYPKTITAAG